MKLMVIGNPTPFLVVLIALDDEVLVSKEIGDAMRLSAGDNGNVSPKALYPLHNVGNLLQFGV